MTVKQLPGKKKSLLGKIWGKLTDGVSAVTLPWVYSGRQHRKNTERHIDLQERLHARNEAIQQENMKLQERQRHDTLKNQALMQERSLEAQTWNTDRSATGMVTN